MTHNLSLTTVVNPHPGWYRGNFHSHTTFSEDGRQTPAELVEIARAEGLDFFAVTDHNSINAYPAFSPNLDLLVIPGIEVTLTAGHFNIFGLPGQLAWMEHICIGQSTLRLNGHFGSVTELIRQITASAPVLSSINHPRRGSCEWLDAGTELQYVNCLEIWNKPHSWENRSANPQAIALWTDWLNAGYRVTAIGGSDFHGGSGERLGLPSTYVYAAELSTPAILEAVRQRRVYVSMGPEVTFQARTNGAVYDIGADLGRASGPINFAAQVTASPAAGCVQVVKNGQVIAETRVTAGETVTLACQDEANPADPAWYRLDVVDQAGRMLALTNPFFSGPRRQPELLKYGDFINRSTNQTRRYS